jgi:hypothetical protein
MEVLMFDVIAFIADERDAASLRMSLWRAKEKQERRFQHSL